MKYVYIVVGGTLLLVLAGTSWVVERLRRPFRREASRRDRIDGMIARYQPPEEALRRRTGPSSDAKRRQFAVWG
jgi:hypothetical protein